MPYPLLLFSPFVDLDVRFGTEELLNTATVVFALVLLAVSVSAYRRTRLRRLLIVSVAFGLFAAEVAFREVNEYVFVLGFQVEQVVITVMEFAILLLFFLAIVAKR